MVLFLFLIIKETIRKMLFLEFGGSSTLGDGKASGNQNIAAVQNGWLWGLVPCH